MKVHLLSYAGAQARSALKSKWMNLGRVAGASGVVTGLLVTGVAVPAEAASVYQASLRTAARSLVVSPEVNAGYDR